MFDKVRQRVLLRAVYMPHVPLCECQAGSDRRDSGRPRLREHDQGQAQIEETVPVVL